MTDTAGDSGPLDGAIPGRDLATAPRTPTQYAPDAQHATNGYGRLRPAGARPTQQAATALVDVALWVAGTSWAAACRYDFELERVRWPVVLAVGVLAGLAQLVAGGCCSLYRNRYTVGSLDEGLALACAAFAVAVF